MGGKCYGIILANKLAKAIKKCKVHTNFENIDDKLTPLQRRGYTKS